MAVGATRLCPRGGWKGKADAWHLAEGDALHQKEEARKNPNSLERANAVEPLGPEPRSSLGPAA